MTVSPAPPFTTHKLYKHVSVCLPLISLSNEFHTHTVSYFPLTSFHPVPAIYCNQFACITCKPPCPEYVTIPHALMRKTRLESKCLIWLIHYICLSCDQIDLLLEHSNWLICQHLATQTFSISTYPHIVK